MLSLNSRVSLKEEEAAGCPFWTMLSTLVAQLNFKMINWQIKMQFNDERLNLCLNIGMMDLAERMAAGDGNGGKEERES